MIAGMMGSMAKILYESPLLISEHGIYSREREEDIIKATWVEGVYKNVWIEHFKKMSTCTYNTADCVTSLFEYAHQLQVELGCPEEKAIITPNGIDPKRFENISRSLSKSGFFTCSSSIDFSLYVGAYRTIKFSSGIS